MEVVYKVYEIVTPSKITNRAKANHTSRGTERKGVEAALPTNPKKFRAGNHKKNSAGHPSYRPTDKTQLLHVPGHSMDESKVL